MESETNQVEVEEPTGPKAPSRFKRQGPFVLVGVTALLVAAVVVYGFLTGRDEAPVEVVATTTTSTTEAPKSDIPYPLSFSQAQTQGKVDSIDWGDRCDTETGRIAAPDFFAPECMAPFIGDNGGSTSRGVTRGNIKIVRYQAADNDPIRTYINGGARIDDTGQQQSIVLADLMGYFNDFYELYGRSVELVTYQSKGPANDEAVARADAQRIAEEIEPFAVIGGPELTNAFAEELATRKIVCIACGTGSTQWFKDRDPYLWSVDASGTQKQIEVTEFIQKQLVGKPAAHAGKDLAKATRVFGYVYLDRGPESNLLAQQFSARLETAGAKPVESIPYTLEPDKIAEKSTEIITKLKAAGVTTVILSTDPATPRALTIEATKQKYSPEWLVAAAPLADSTLYGRYTDQSQWKHAFGVSNSAIRTNSEAGNYFALYEWYTGRSPFADETIEYLVPPYALLMSAIQSAGPNLTPESLAGAIRGLASKQATSQPFLRWGDHSLWEDGDYSGTDDFTIFWWDSAATGPDDRRFRGTGMVSFVDSGKRYLPGELANEDRLFLADGAASLLAAIPAGEEIKQYPSPAAQESSDQSSTSSSAPTTTSLAVSSSSSSTPSSSTSSAPGSSSTVASATTTTVR